MPLFLVLAWVVVVFKQSQYLNASCIWMKWLKHGVGHGCLCSSLPRSRRARNGLISCYSRLMQKVVWGSFQRWPGGDRWLQSPRNSSTQHAVDPHQRLLGLRDRVRSGTQELHGDQCYSSPEAILLLFALPRDDSNLHHPGFNTL